jgi:hypothetical protein
MSDSVGDLHPLRSNRHTQKAESAARFGPQHEWHLDLRKSLLSADIGNMGLSCFDGSCNNPS